MNYKISIVVACAACIASWLMDSILDPTPRTLKGCVQFQDIFIPKKYLMPGSNSFIKVPGMEFDKANGMQVVILPDGKGNDIYIQIWGKYARQKNGDDTEAKPAFEQIGSKSIQPDPNLAGLYRFYHMEYEGKRLNVWFLVNSPQPPKEPDAQWAVASCSGGRSGIDCYYNQFSHNLWYMINFKPERYSSLAELDNVIKPHLNQWKTCITPLEE